MMTPFRLSPLISRALSRLIMCLKSPNPALRMSRRGKRVTFWHTRCQALVHPSHLLIYSPPASTQYPCLPRSLPFYPWVPIGSVLHPRVPPFHEKHTLVSVQILVEKTQTKLQIETCRHHCPSRGHYHATLRHHPSKTHQNLQDRTRTKNKTERQRSFPLTNLCSVHAMGVPWSGSPHIGCKLHDSSMQVLCLTSTCSS